MSLDFQSFLLSSKDNEFPFNFVELKNILTPLWINIRLMSTWMGLSSSGDVVMLTAIAAIRRLVDCKTLVVIAAAGARWRHELTHQREIYWESDVCCWIIDIVPKIISEKMKKDKKRICKCIFAPCFVALMTETEELPRKKMLNGWKILELNVHKSKGKVWFVCVQCINV